MLKYRRSGNVIFYNQFEIITNHMKHLKQNFKILLLVFIIIAIVILVATITVFYLDRPTPTMSDEELEQFSDYSVFDGNLHCLAAEEYLGEVTSEIDYYYVRNAKQHLYKIKGLDVSDGILSYSKGIGLFSNNSIVLMFPHNAENPLFSWDIESIEICDVEVSYGIDQERDPTGYKGIMSYSIDKFEAAKGESRQIIDDSESINTFVQSLKANYDTTHDIASYETRERLFSTPNNRSRIKVSFKDNPGIIWLATIFKDDTDGQVYLILSKPSSETKGLDIDSYMIPISIDVDPSLFD